MMGNFKIENIRVVLKSCKGYSYKEFNNILSDMSYCTYKACNLAITYFYQHDMSNSILFNELSKKYDDKEIYGKTFGAWVENRMNEVMKDYSSSGVASTRQFINKRYNTDKKKGLLKGDISLSRFKRNMPIYIHNKSYKISQGDKGYEIELALFSEKYKKEHNIGLKERVHFYIDKLNNNKKVTLNKIISGQYKQGTIQIIKDRKGKWELLISFTFECEDKKLDYNRILGIDLGIVNTATLQIYDKNISKYDWLTYKECMIDGQEIIKFRQRVETRRKYLAISNKWCGNGKIGHGKQTRMKSVWEIGDKINRFKDTYNHKISRYIVDFAVKYNCGTIQMEDLSGFTEQVKDTFLKNWSYYDLQNKVKYKAEKIGITVIFILPMYTSLRCNNCGFIDRNNRDCKNNQAKFECNNCDYGHINKLNKGKINADINAARNIALPDIEQIILKQLKLQSKLSDEYLKMYNTYIKALKNKKKSKTA